MTDSSPISNYQSPFSQRYGTEAMRAIWSERNKRLLWRKLWVALAEAQLELGIVQAGAGGRSARPCRMM